MQNLEVENAMLKNELNVMNREISELLDRLRITEDGMDSIVFIYIRYIFYMSIIFNFIVMSMCLNIGYQNSKAHRINSKIVKN